MESIHLGTCKMWSLQAGGLYMQVVFRVGLTVYCNKTENEMIYSGLFVQVIAD